jgi:hypothetical protein
MVGTICSAVCRGPAKGKMSYPLIFMLGATASSTALGIVVGTLAGVFQSLLVPEQTRLFIIALATVAFAALEFGATGKGPRVRPLGMRRQVAQ